MLALAVAQAGTMLCGQNGTAVAPTSAPTADLRAARTKFEALPALRQAMVVHRAESALSQGANAVVRCIAACRFAPDDLPDASPTVHFDPAVWAPVAPARHVIAKTEASHRAVREAMPAITVLDDLHRAVVYDWRSGKIVKAAALSWAERFANLLAGYPPGADAAFAKVLEALDRDPKQRRLADYFAHAYADRNGGVYEGVTLYEAWYANDTLEMPDVDAIAFAVRILGDDTYSSPIPADARRDRLYERLGSAALAHRKHRTMLEAAAAAFVCAEPAMDPMYARLAPRFHYLFATHDDDLARVREVLGKLQTRDALIEFVDRTVVADEQAMDRRERRKEDLQAMAEAVRASALRELAAEPEPTGNTGR